ncbi:hypothetical protein LP415_21045 [Polaromonas sp. P1(28)-8]|nr:hypothetical protein LP415_21045 [Polaromonas sp. P1(28)-8]
MVVIFVAFSNFKPWPELGGWNGTAKLAAPKLILGCVAMTCEQRIPYEEASVDAAAKGGGLGR